MSEQGVARREEFRRKTRSKIVVEYFPENNIIVIRSDPVTLEQFSGYYYRSPVVERYILDFSVALIYSVKGVNIPHLKDDLIKFAEKYNLDLETIDR